MATHAPAGPGRLKAVSIASAEAADHMVTGDFNGDGYTELADVYNYGNGTIGIEIWSGQAGGGYGTPTQVSKCGPNCWTWSISKFVAGDFNGDGQVDLVGMYDYGSGARIQLRSVA
jgi:hypothetical protein